MSEFKIGEFDFINMSRAISRPTRRLSREVRSGVAGVTLWDTGKRAEPIVVATVVDTADEDAATARLAQYEAIVGGDPVTVTWFGNLLDGVQVVVLDVQPFDGGVHKMLLGVGGTIGGESHGLCRVVWFLNPIETGQ